MNARVRHRAAHTRHRAAHARSRGLTAVEVAVGIAIGGSILAVSVPAFVRELASSRFVEPVSGVQKMADLAVAYGHDRPASQAFPPSAPLTPGEAPRAVQAVDAPGAWDQASWKELGFRPVAEGVPHAFAFAFDSTAAPGRSTFVARAHGDLDGDGITSTFEMRGHSAEGEGGPMIEPGMHVEAEVE